MEYAQEIRDYLYRIEEENRVRNVNYFQFQPEITPGMREKLVAWMFEVVMDEFKLPLDVFSWQFTFWINSPQSNL